MKKLIKIASALLCAVMLTACGSTSYTEYEQAKIETAEMYTSNVIIPLMGGFMDGSATAAFPWDEYTMEEVGDVVHQLLYNNTQGYVDMEVDGYGFYNAISSFSKGVDEVGMIVSVGNVSSVIDDDQIIVTADVVGETRDGQVEVIFSNDMFLKLEAATLNTNYTFGEKMSKAGLNTLIGMGTVFIVLILISGLISLFNLIPKAQAYFAKKKADKEATANAATAGIDNAVNQIIENETAAEDVSDDMELVAVIAAAIAAYEGSASADGVVVRSIRKIRR